MAITFKSVLIDNNSSSGEGGSGTEGLSITVQPHPMFAGSTVTCSDGTTTLVQTFSNNAPYQATFSIPNGGTWTVSSTLNNQEYIETVIVPASLFFHLDGKTITPINDVSTWLICGCVFDKSYTSLSQVLADSETLNTLMSSSNAVDYLVRSTSWVSDICSNELAMTYIGANNYCAETLLDNATWFNTIYNSNYRTNVLNAYVPTMTSDTEPSGKVTYDSYYYQGGYDPKGYRAFDKDNNTFWESDITTPHYIQYEFDDPVKVYKLFLRNRHNSTKEITDAFQVFVSNSGEFNGEEVVVFSGNNTNRTQGSESYYTLSPSGYYKYWRFKVISTDDLYGYVSIGELQFYGRTSSVS